MKTYEILDSVDYIVTFNGKHFDVPFIENRGRKYGLNWHFAGYDLDLYLLVNGQPQIKSVLPNLKQKTVEIFMPINAYILRPIAVISTIILTGPSQPVM
jgi:Predicted exonuclease